MSTPPRTRYLTGPDGRTRRLSEWAREAGIAENSILRRLELGWGEADAVSRPLQQQPHYIAVHGKEMTLSQWAKRTGLRASTIYRRLEAGWKPADAVNRPPRRRVS